MTKLEQILQASDPVLRNISHPSVAGPDRFLRLIQGLARLAAWQISKIDLNPQQSKSAQETFLKLARQISLTSKLTRALKIPEFLQVSATLARKQPLGPFASFVTVAKLLGLAAFSVLDFACYLHFVNIKSLPGVDKVQRRAFQAWLFSIVAGIIVTLRDMAVLQKAQQNLSKEEKKSGAAALSKKQAGLRSRLYVDVCDCITATSILRYHDLNQGIVSVAGILSSLIQMYTSPLPKKP